MSSIDLSDYKELYLKTAKEYLTAMHASIVNVTVSGNNLDAIELIHRSAHSLKSQSAIMGYRNTAALNEYIEHTLKNVLDKKNGLTEKILSDIKAALQKIEASIESIEMTNREIALTEPISN